VSLPRRPCGCAPDARTRRVLRCLQLDVTPLRDDVGVSGEGDREVFHLRVELAAGTSELMPLSELATSDPAAYEAAIAKYDDSTERQRLRETTIPLLNRRWTEVVFLSPVHPHAIWQAWGEITPKPLPPVEFWAISIDTLPTPIVVLDRKRSAVGDPIQADEVSPLDTRHFQTLFETTQSNRAWLEMLTERGLKGGWFKGIPHVLTTGHVPISSARTLSWDEHPMG